MQVGFFRFRFFIIVCKKSIRDEDWLVISLGEQLRALLLYTKTRRSFSLKSRGVRLGGEAPGISVRY